MRRRQLFVLTSFCLCLILAVEILLLTTRVTSVSGGHDPQLQPVPTTAVQPPRRRSTIYRTIGTGLSAEGDSSEVEGQPCSPQRTEMNAGFNSQFRADDGYSGEIEEVNEGETIEVHLPGQYFAEPQFLAICSLETMRVAFAISPTGEVFQPWYGNITDQNVYYVRFPITAYSQPGTWTLYALNGNDPFNVNAYFDIGAEIPVANDPFVLADGSSLLLGGFETNEQIIALLLGPLEYCIPGYYDESAGEWETNEYPVCDYRAAIIDEVEFQVDADGYAFITVPETVNQAQIFLGASGNNIIGLEGTIFNLGIGDFDFDIFNADRELLGEVLNDAYWNSSGDNCPGTALSELISPAHGRNLLAEVSIFTQPNESSEVAGHIPVRLWFNITGNHTCAENALWFPISYNDNGSEVLGWLKIALLSEE